MDDNCVFNFFSQSSGTAVTFTGSHFNQAVLVVYIATLLLIPQAATNFYQHRTKLHN